MFEAIVCMENRQSHARPVEAVVAAMPLASLHAIRIGDIKWWPIYIVYVHFWHKISQVMDG